jgi:hypothetical protein
VYIGVPDHFTKLLKVYFTVLIFVGKEDCLVYDLLQLSVFQVGAHHHFQHLEELAVADIPVVINIVDSEIASKKKFKCHFLKEVEKDKIFSREHEVLARL